MADRKKWFRGPLTLLQESRRARRWAIAAVILGVLYPLSIGPAAGIMHWLGDPIWYANVYNLAYRPITYFDNHEPRKLGRMFAWYVETCRGTGFDPRVPPAPPEVRNQKPAIAPDGTLSLSLPQIRTGSRIQRPAIEFTGSRDHSDAGGAASLHPRSCWLEPAPFVVSRSRQA